MAARYSYAAKATRLSSTGGSAKTMNHERRWDSTAVPEKKALRLAQAIVDRVIENNLGAGDMLPRQAILMEEYSVSLGTLREALRLLETQGVVSMRSGPAGGPVVAPVDSRPMAMNMALLLQRERATYRSVVDGRLMFEPIIARVAAIQVQSDEIEELEKELARTRQAVSAGSSLVPNAAGFHHLIAASTRNPAYVATAQALHRIGAYLNRFVAYDTERSEEVLATHEDLLNALKKRDEARCEEVMRRDINEFISHVEKLDPSHLEMPVAWSHGATEFPAER